MCDNQICQQLRVVIRQKLSEGQTPNQVIDYLVSRYGESILLSPPRHGFNLTAWYLPIVGLVVGASIVVTVLGRSLARKREIERQREPPGPALGRYREQVRRDLENQIRPAETAESLNLLRPGLRPTKAPDHGRVAPK